MTRLEEDVDRLRDLDRSRDRAAKLRNDGWQTLLDGESPSPLKSPPEETAAEESPPEEQSILATAEVLKALLTRRALAMSKALPVLDRLTGRLEQVTDEEALSSDPDRVPVLRSAKAMCALAAAPDSAFSSSMMYFLYTIVREIYVAAPPEWSVGGARAGEGAASSGFVTWQCVRAIVDFQQAMTQTAEFLQEVAAVLRQNERYETAYRTGRWDFPETPPCPPRSGALKQWEWVDATRLDVSFLNTLDSLRDNLALKLDALHDLFEGPAAGHVGIFISRLRADLEREIAERRDDFEQAEEALTLRRAELQRNLSERRDALQGAETTPGREEERRRIAVAAARFRLTATAHEIALETVHEAGEYAEGALARFDPAKPSEKELEDIAEQFCQAARAYDKLLQPVTAHVARVLDGELGAASFGSPYAWDPAELAFATAAYAEATRRWNDERVKRAMDRLLGVVGERGEFPVGKPIRTSERLYRLHTTNADVIRALARVLEHAHDVELAPSVVKRMVAFFEATPPPAAPATGEPRPTLTVLQRRRTAADVLALNSIHRMLDVRINHLVFRHFSVKQPQDLSIPLLAGLFYPDYGLRVTSASATAQGSASPPEGEASPPAGFDDKDASLAAHGVYRKRSVAEVLERMRAHVTALVQPDESAPVFSLVLHGPPGTGKTTLVESLAKTCHVPMLEVTPSDIVIAGVDAIESQARAVFYALSLLTNVVILLDEFDPVLLRRSPQERSPSAFSFLTPGMLPKLKTLHDRAKERSVAYVLVTNLIGKLDEAAIRGGRFDEHLGIYPPDLLSRFGRLHQEVRAYDRRLEAREKPAQGVPGRDERIWEVVQNTAGMSMNTLGKPGWFTAPKKDTPGKDNAFSYVYSGEGEGSRFGSLEPEAYLELLAISPELEKKARKAQEEEKARKAEEKEERSNPAGSPPAADLADEEPLEHERESHAEREFKEWAWTVIWDGDARGKAAPFRSAQPGSPPDEVELPGVPSAERVDDKWQRALKDWLSEHAPDAGRRAT